MNAPKRLRFDWVWGTLFRPRKTLPSIVAQPGSSWQMPLLILTVTALILVLVSGWLQGQNAAAPELSPDFQYLSPEQQAQMMQSLQMSQGPIFRFVFPAITSMLGVWVGWLLVGGLLHLLMTLFGGRGDTSSAMNLVGWSNLPFAVRDIVQILAMLFTRKLISSPGLSGFINTEAGGISLFLAGLLSLVDIYLFWRLLLLLFGVKTATGLSTGKALISALAAILIILLLQAGLSYLGSMLGSLSIVRMFF
jgi:hypothetical protein